MLAEATPTITDAITISESALEKMTQNDTSFISTIMRFSIGTFSVSDGLQILFAIIFCKIAVTYILKLLNKTFSHVNIDSGLKGFIKSSVKVIIYILGALIILDAFGIALTQIIAVIGLLGLAISLSIQNFLSNLMSGITILINKPFVVGNYINASSSEGTVEDIGLLYTQIKTIDNKQIFIPNSVMSSNTIVNYSFNSIRKISTTIQVSYNSDIDKVLKVTKSLINSNDRIIKEPEPIVHLLSFGDSGLNILVRFSIKNEDYFDILFSFNENLFKLYAENNIEFPYPQMDIHIKDNNKAIV